MICASSSRPATPRASCPRRWPRSQAPGRRRGRQRLARRHRGGRASPHGARVVREPRPSRAAGPQRRRPRDHRAELLAFLDADCVPRPRLARRRSTAASTRAPLVGRPASVEATGTSDVRALRRRLAAAARRRRSRARAGRAAGNLGDPPRALRRARRLRRALPPRRRGRRPVPARRRRGLGLSAPDAVVRHAADATLRAVLASAASATGTEHAALPPPRRASAAATGATRGRSSPATGRCGASALDRPGAAWAPARADYAGRVAGSAWAELRRRQVAERLAQQRRPAAATSPRRRRRRRGRRGGAPSSDRGARRAPAGIAARAAPRAAAARRRPNSRWTKKTRSDQADRRRRSPSRARARRGPRRSAAASRPPRTRPPTPRCATAIGRVRPSAR